MRGAKDGAMQVRQETEFRLNGVAPEGMGDEFAGDVLTGLSAAPKQLPCKYIYDDRGSRLFTEITHLPEYYLTRCETEILRSRRGTIVDLLPQDGFNLVELGAGDGQKTKLLLDEIVSAQIDCHYTPIDISKAAIEGLLTTLQKEIPKIRARGIVSEYFLGLRRLSALNHRPNVVLFLGSNIGNFSSKERSRFLGNLSASLNHGDMVLVGFDLRKEVKTLVEAYNDRQGVTAQFNLNLLRRINRELGGEFEVDNFEYYSTYSPETGGVNSYLISRTQQTVAVRSLGCEFKFTPSEPIHTELSQKFSPSEICKLAYHHQFEAVGVFYDSRRYFADALWRVRKPNRSSFPPSPY